MVEELSIKKNALHMLDLIDPLRIRDHQNKFVDLRIWLEEISGNKSIPVLYDHDSNVETKAMEQSLCSVFKTEHNL